MNLTHGQKSLSGPERPSRWLCGNFIDINVFRDTEVDTMDFGIDPRSREKMCSLEDEYMSGPQHAVTLVNVNISLAIRNAFDRLQDVHDRHEAA